MKNLEIALLALAIAMTAACETTQTKAFFPSRSLVLDGTAYSEDELGKITSWRCRKFVQPGGVLVEVGVVSSSQRGFVLYDGGNSGAFTDYQREGLNHRWDWGRQKNFSVIIRPDGTGLYYDFSSVAPGESTKADAVYKCSQ